MVEVLKRSDEQFPVGLLVDDSNLQKLTLKAAKELRLKLNEAIEWAVNMDDLRREANAPAQPPSD